MIQLRAQSFVQKLYAARQSHVVSDFGELFRNGAAFLVFGGSRVGGDIEVTRSGMRSRDSDYSHQAPITERQQVSRECSAIADHHINQVLDYIKRTDALAAQLERPRRADSQRTQCKIIGE